MAIGSNPNVRTQAGSDPLEIDRAKLVHEARKTIKRMRALARLLRYELGKQELGRVNSSLRAAGQRLAGARDAEVRLETLKKLTAGHARTLALDGIVQLAKRLHEERERASQPADPEVVLCDIVEMRRVLNRWSLVDPDFDVLGPGLQRIYREGRKRYARAKREHARNAEHVHDWRKRVKALYYALDMLGACDAKGARGITRRAKQLGELLGEDHDLWMLCAYVQCHDDACGHDARAREVLLSLIEHRRASLRKRALKRGKRLYKRKPRTFARLISASLDR
jgi:CHAD domain-containing protein